MRIASLILLGLVLTFAGSLAAQVNQAFGTPGSYDLLVNNRMKVGTVTVSNDATNLDVTVDLINGWETHRSAAHVGASLNDFPRSRSGRARPARFDYQLRGGQWVSSFTYSTTLANAGYTGGNADLLVAVASRVKRKVRVGRRLRVQNCLAWIDGSEFCRRGGHYATYTVQREDLTGKFTTFTAVDWAGASNATNLGGYLDANFGCCFANGVTVGYPQRVNGINGCAATFTTACAIRAILPTTGQPCPLRGRYTNPSGAFGQGGEAGQLLGQVLALALNVGFDECDDDFNAGCVAFKDLCIVDSSSPLCGKTVGWVLDEANWRLSGLGDVTTNPDADHQLNISYSLISSTVAAINANFARGADNGFLGICFKQGDYETYTQNGWRTYNDAAGRFASAFGNNGMTVGDPRRFGNLQGCSATFTSMDNVQRILPRTGQPCPLTGAYTNPTGGVNQGREAGELLGNVMALALNVAFDNADADYNPHCIPLEDLVIVWPNSPARGKTVGWVLAEANWQLSGLGTVMANPDPDHDLNLSFGQINRIVELINANFPNGQDCKYLGAVIEQGDYNTLTQGDANDAGWAEVSNGTNLASYRNANFCCAFPNGALVGDPRRIGNVQGCSARFTCGKALGVALSNASGQPCPLTGAYVNPDAVTEAQEAGVLLAEVLALAMNVAYDECDANFGADQANLKDLIVDDPNSAAYGKSVAWVLAEANFRLSGLGQYVQNPDAGHDISFTFDEINDLAAAINANFRGGTTDNGLLRRP